MRFIYLLIFFQSIFSNISISQKYYCNYRDTDSCYYIQKFVTPEIKLNKVWESEIRVPTGQICLVADVDGDCIPEIFVKRIIQSGQFGVADTAKLTFINSLNGKIKYEFDCYFFHASDMSFVLVDVDNDGLMEIIIGWTLYQFQYRPLACYDLKGNLKWVSNADYYPSFTAARGQPSLGVADFNKDGIPEVYCYNRIFNAQTGKLLVQGWDGQGGNNVGITMHQVSVAAHLDDDPSDLELASGYSIYKIKLINLTDSTGNRLTPYNIQVDGMYLDGKTAVADINQDGRLDVIVSHSAADVNSRVYVYSLVNNIPTLLAKSFIPGMFEVNGFPNISDIDGNSKPNILVTKNNLINNFEYNGTATLQLIWSFAIYDRYSYSGLITYDLDGDNIPEIIHRGDSLIYIIDGKTNPPTRLDSTFCSAITLNENCVVADIDNSGQSRICTICGTGPNDNRFGRLTVFGPPDGQRWAPARPVWNQYAYNPIFINDDLTVPQYQKNHATYQNGKYNNFMQQESLLDENGYYMQPATSLTGLIHCVDYDPVTDSFTVRFELHNRRDASRLADVDLPVSFYGANPELDSSLLGVYLTTEIIKPGDSLRNLSFRFSASDLTRIYLVVNTRRNTTGPFDSTHFDQPECDYTDNFYYIIDLPIIQRDSMSICEGSEYMFYDTVLYDAGKYHRSLENEKGCDSLIVLLDLSLSNTVRTQTSLSACEIYDWNGKMLTQSGIYTDTSLTSGGCDSIATLDLRIHPSVSQTQTISACDAYDWNGQTYTQSGQYVFYGQTENGCDSTVTLDLTIHSSALIEQTHATCDSYLWNGQTYSTSGHYTFQTQTQNGCDSMVILNLTIDSVIRQQISHSTCDRYIWNGQTLTQSRIYTHQDISQAGCDSIVTLELTVLSSSSSMHRIATCDSYLWNGNIYTQSGNYQFSSTNADGCDSVATLELTILSSSNSMSQINTCESYLWNGNNYTQSGIYEFKTQNAVGCDSTATLELTILPIHQNIIQESACIKYIWNGITYDQSGNYTFNTKNQFGCDSSITLELEILKSSSANISLSTCDSLVFLGQTLTESGTYPFNIRNAAGCDSVIILNLSINSNQQISSVASCDPFRWDVDGQNYTQSGRYLKNFTNAQGCDSIHILDFKRLPSHLINEKAEVCGPFFWNVTNTLLDQSGQYSHPLQTTEGCDSLLNLDLIIHPHFIKTDTVISQTDYVWPVNNTNYSVSGNYEEQYSSEFGCDSIHRLILIIKNEQGIYYPNVLIPGGISGGFTIFDNLFTLSSITTLSIYDRWGSLVWQKHNFAPNDPTLGWDGRFKGQHIVPGVYTWHAQLTLKDGTYKTVKGDLTVVR